MNQAILEMFEEGLRSGKNPTVKEYEKEFGPLDQETRKAMATVKFAYRCKDDFIPPWLNKERQGEKKEESEFNAAAIFSRVARNRSFAMGGSHVPFDLMKKSGVGVVDSQENGVTESSGAFPDRHLHFHLEQNITPKDELKRVEKRLKGKMKSETRVMMEFMLECIKPVQRLIKHELNKLLKQGREIYLKKDYNTALNLYTEAINLEPNSDDAWTGLGVTLRRQGKPEEALKYLEKATKLNSHNDKAWSNRGITLCELKRYDESLPFYDRAIKENLKNHWAYFGKANALMQLERLDEALIAYQKVTEIAPDYTDAWMWMGYLLLTNTKRYQEALNAFGRITKDSPSLGWRLYGDTLSKLQRPEEARNAYEKALQEHEDFLTKSPELDLVWKSKGDVLKSLGRQEEAQKCFQKAEELQKQQGKDKK